MTYEQVKKDHAVQVYITQADASMEALGFTEHSFAHVTRVSDMAGELLETMGHPQRTVELARIAGYLHDIGNVVNRSDHSQSGAVMAFRILDRMDFPPEEIATIVTAIGNHDEGTGVPVNAVAAALIIADKSDVRRSRVRHKELSDFDKKNQFDIEQYVATYGIPKRSKKDVFIELDLTGVKYPDDLVSFAIEEAGIMMKTDDNATYEASETEQNI